MDANTPNSIPHIQDVLLRHVALLESEIISLKSQLNTSELKLREALADEAPCVACEAREVADTEDARRRYWRGERNTRELTPTGRVKGYNKDGSPRKRRTVKPVETWEFGGRTFRASGIERTPEEQEKFERLVTAALRWRESVKKGFIVVPEGLPRGFYSAEVLVERYQKWSGENSDQNRPDPLTVRPVPSAAPLGSGMTGYGA